MSIIIPLTFTNISDLTIGLVRRVFFVKTRQIFDVFFFLAEQCERIQIARVP